MGRRRGFFAELQHQAKQAERERLRRQREASRRYVVAMREAERQRRAEENALAQAARASLAERKELERAARQAHVESMEAEVQRRNAELQVIDEDLAGILAATLEVDDFVDLESLRVGHVPPAFPRPDLEVPLPRPAEPPPVPQPQLVLPPEPTGVLAFLLRGKHRKSVQRAEQAHEKVLGRWHEQVTAASAQFEKQTKEHAAAEAARLSALALARAEHEREAAELARKSEQQNARLDRLIGNLSYGVAEAVDEYVSIVLANSVYPESLAVEHEFSYDPQTAELRLTVLIPPPGQLPSVLSYKYSKASDSIETRDMSRKAQKDRYSCIVNQVALRSLHEVFEADRRGVIKSIALIVGTETVDPATGNDARIPFAAVAAQREAFVRINLARVDAEATLKHLGASLSKNAIDLQAADVSGIRKA